MHSWHDVNPERVSSKRFLAMIEISKGSKNKYELDKETGHLMLDRILYTSTQYPHNYGFIPLTYAEDKDPLDVLVLCSEAILPMAFVKCKPIGVLYMTDNGKFDEKIIAVAVDDPFYNDFEDISEIPTHVKEEIKHFFSVYKNLEEKPTAVDVIEGRSKAEEVINKCLERYKKEILPSKKND